MRELLHINKLSDPEYKDISEFLSKDESILQENYDKKEIPPKINMDLIQQTDADDAKLASDMIANFKLNKKPKIKNDKSLSQESEGSTNTSEDHILYIGGNIPMILNNNESPSNSTGISSAKEENHIHFFNSDLLLSNKDNNNDSLTSSMIKSNSNSSLIWGQSSSIIFRNSLDGKA